MHLAKNGQIAYGTIVQGFYSVDLLGGWFLQRSRISYFRREIWPIQAGYTQVSTILCWLQLAYFSYPNLLDTPKMKLKSWRPALNKADAPRSTKLTKMNLKAWSWGQAAQGDGEGGYRLGTDHCRKVRRSVKVRHHDPCEERLVSSAPASASRWRSHQTTAHSPRSPPPSG